MHMTCTCTCTCASLGRAVRTTYRGTTGGAQAAHLWLHAPKNNLQTQGVWVHQPAEHLHSSHADHEWVEVTHCYYSSEGVRSWTPMWFFAVPGS